MKQIGIIASGASDASARVILNEGEEKRVKVEKLVLVENRNEGFIMAALRQGLDSNENLEPGGYHPGVAYARIGGNPSALLDAVTDGVHYLFFTGIITLA